MGKDNIVPIAMVIGLILVMITLVFCAITIEVQKEKLQAIEVVAYHSAYENPQMWVVLDIIDGKLGE